MTVRTFFRWQRYFADRAARLGPEPGASGLASDPAAIQQTLERLRAGGLRG